MFYGLTPLGVAHTVVSLIAVTTGLIALIRDREISPRNVIGKLYVIMTVLTGLTAFGIFQHGGFGKPHALSIVTSLANFLYRVGWDNAFASPSFASQQFDAQPRISLILRRPDSGHGRQGISFNHK